MLTEDELKTSSLERLRRKRDQAWEMAGLARQDRNSKDADSQTKEARRIAEEIGERVRGGEA